MRVTLFVAAFVAVATFLSPTSLRSALATSASTLFEATPFVFAGVALAAVVRRPVIAFVGCGCGSGPSARSLPATAAAWLVFGPAVALARFLAAFAVARLVGNVKHDCVRDSGTGRARPLDELAGVLPAALIAGAVMQLPALVDVGALKPLAQIAAGLLFAFAASPCGVGAVAIAGALHARAPLAASAFLCIAGIADLRAFVGRRRSATPAHDVLAYAMLALALAIIGGRHGGALVHPAIAGSLLACCVVAIVLGVVHRTQHSAPVRYAPALMLAGALVAAPPPAYRATETTLSELFPGERLSFTGSVTRNGNADALVRYAITCCRADAAPVVVRLAHRTPFPAGAWLRVEGTIAMDAGEARLVALRAERIAPPADPFIYR